MLRSGRWWKTLSSTGCRRRRSGPMSSCNCSRRELWRSQKDDLRRAPGMPLLYVWAAVAPPKGTSSGYAYHVQVEVLQLIVLTRNPDVFSLARTWNAKGGLGAVGADSLAKTVKEAVHGMTEQFVTAFLAANPKR